MHATLAVLVTHRIPKTPQDASRNLTLSPQPKQTKHLITVENNNTTSGNMRRAIVSFHYCALVSAIVCYRSLRGMPEMKPMFLPAIENSPQPSGYRDIIQTMQSAGAEYPQIWHLFAFLPKATEHLARFTQEIMRGPAPLSPGIRELIAAYTSDRNECPF